MESVIPLHSHDSSDSQQDWDIGSDQCSESIPSTTPSEEYWSQKIHPYLWIRMANTVYTEPYRRCLIENTVQDMALSYVHCLSRRLESRRVNALEFAWGMQRGTLNLNTRLNVLCLSPKFKDFWESLKWFLLPEDHIIRHFHEAAMNDRDFSDIAQDGPYNYRFVPHPDMKNVAIHRQINQETEFLKAEHFIFCSYPFEDVGSLLLDKTNLKHLSFLKNKINHDDIISEKHSRTGNGRLKPRISSKHLKKGRTGLKRKRKGSPPHFVPTRKLRILEEQMSRGHAFERKFEDILSWRSTVLGRQ